MAKVALVTGSSRGIGLGSALALAKAGFSIALNGPVADAELESAVKKVREAGAANVWAAAFDVSDLTAHEEALDSVETALGQLTTLVNNAGVGVLSRGDPLNVSEASWDRCMAVNAKGTFFLTQAFAKRAVARVSNEFRSIINVTSSNAAAAAVLRAEYAASKAATAMSSQTWAVRLGGEGIAVYDVQPGIIETDMTTAVIDDYKKRVEAGLTLFPRVGQPEDIGQIIATLASGALPYTTGHVISADGGMLVRRF